ncbi:MAG: zinc metalloprotease HtpX [Bryobacterales bacterium]|nr:zinc metalloprotease HtpX [Bryobacterales bacterium]
MNGVKTVLLLGALSGLLLVGGQAIGGQRGLIMAFGFAVLMNFASYFFSDKIALSMYSAQPVSRSANPQVYDRIGPLTQELTRRMGLPMPKLWLIPDHSPNAFATGRNPEHASVAVTAGILELMNDRELEGVIAHELGHVKHRDILISSIAATIGAAITMIGRMAFWFGGSRRSDEEGNSSPLAGLAMLVVAPFAAMVIQMAISRTREFSADAAAAKYTGSPDGLISGLRKLETYSKRIPMDASPATAHMFIIKPFTGQALMSLFSTHPPTEKRVAALEALRGEPTWSHGAAN